jgi:hypothetical protein
VRVVASAGESDDAGLTSEQSQDAWIIVDWQDPRHRAVKLHGFVPNGSKWLDRSLVFAAEDPEDERGRTIGFVISAMFANAATQAPRHDTTRTPSDRTQAPRHDTNRTPSDRAQSLRDQAANATKVPPGKPKAWAASLAASAAGFGDADSFGATTSIERGSSQARLGLFADARFGAIPNAQSSTRFLTLGLVGNVRLLASSGATWIGLGLQVGASHVTVTHFSEDDIQPVRHAALMPMTAGLLRANHELSQSTWLFVEAGPEYRFGRVEVNVRGKDVARIPALTGELRLGMLTRF